MTAGGESPSRPTVRDVAVVAGVSPITVSRVLNRSPLVASETAQRVRDVLAEMGFRPNQSARNLRNGRTVTTIALVVSDIGNPFSATLARAVEVEVQQRDALLVIASCGDDAQRERKVVTTLLERGVDGLLMYPTSGDHAYLGDDLTEKRPVVVLGREPAGVEADSIVVDNIGASARAVKHLVKAGHRRISLIGYGRDKINQLDPTVDHRYGRIEGYRRALRASGIPYDDELVRADCAGAEAAERAVRELRAINDPPTALFTTNNRMTVGAVRALGIGLDGVALIGFDDFELADVFDPPISVIAPDPAEMGRRAARVMFDRLGGADGPTVRMNVPVRLVARGSGELAPAHS